MRSDKPRPESAPAVPCRKPGLWLGGAVLGLLLLGWIAALRMGPAEGHVPVQLAARMPGATPDGPVAATDAVAAAAAADAVAAHTAGGEADKAAICGLPDTEPLEGTIGEAIGRQLESAAEQGIRVLHRALAASADPQERAMRLVLKSYLKPSAADAADAAASADAAEAGDAVTTGGLSSGAMTADVADALARVALASTDTRPYAIAAMACSRAQAALATAPEGACGQIDLWTWALNDVGNAAPWLMLAQRANAANDVVAFDQAMFNAAHADRFEYGAFDALRLVNHPAVQRLKPTVRVATMLMLTAIWVDWQTPGHAAVMAWCPQGLEEANRQQACGDLATMLIDRSSAMIDVSLGVGIASAAGWSEERVLQADLRRDAYARLLAQGVPQAPPLGCAWMRDQARWAGQVAQAGDAGLARRLLAASGEDAATIVGRSTPERRSRFRGGRPPYL